MLRKLLREPLFHFFVLGGMLFVLYAVLNRGAMRSPDEIVVDQSRLDALSTQFEQTWQRPPDAAELQGLVDAWVREEVLYREGLAAGLEQGDTVVRRRVVQKMAFMSAGMATAVAPTDAELQAWLDEHPERYAVPPSYTFQQVFFDPRRHGEALDADIASAKARLSGDPDAKVGDSTLLPRRLDDAPAYEVSRVFGDRFADGLANVPEGGWQGPVRSGFGVHLVRVQARSAPRVPPLDEVRREVERDLTRARGEAMSEQLYQALRDRYTVKVEARAPAAPEADGKGGAGTTGNAGAATP